MPGIAQYLEQMQTRSGSDLHLASGVPPIVRVHGTLERLSDQNLTDAEVVAMAREIVPASDIERVETEKNLDFALQYGTDPEGRPYRYRGNLYKQKNGLNIVLRGIQSRVPTLEDLGLPPELAKLTNYHQGLVLATGQAGSGKTATLAALINIINQSKPVHIITVEDPIEYIHVNAKALVNQRQVGRDVESFKLALKGALREDPDVILVGELRDLDTISLAITAAETGHLVLGTLHTNSAAKTIDRLIDAFPVDQQAQVRTMLSESLRGVIAQQLIPKKDGTGRAAAVEVLVGNNSVANLIREGKTYQIPMAMQTGRKDGMRIMDASILELYEKGIIGKDEAQARSVNKSGYRDTAASEASMQA